MCTFVTNVSLLQVIHNSTKDSVWISVFGILTFHDHPLYAVILIVHDWSQQSELRPYIGQFPPYCCWATHPQLSKAVFFTEYRWLLLCCMEWDSRAITSVLYASIKCLLLKNKLLCFFVVMLILLLAFCKFLVPSRCFISITRTDDFLTYQP